jgi:hypothetical protein
MEAELNLDPDSNPDPESDPELIRDPDPDPNLQIISDPAGSGCTTLVIDAAESKRAIVVNVGDSRRRKGNKFETYQCHRRH